MLLKEVVDPQEKATKITKVNAQDPVVLVRIRVVNMSNIRFHWHPSTLILSRLYRMSHTTIF